MMDFFVRRSMICRNATFPIDFQLIIVLCARKSIENWKKSNSLLQTIALNDITNSISLYSLFLQ